MFLAAGEARDYQVRSFENQEMLRHSLPAHVQAKAQLAQRPPIVSVEAVQELVCGKSQTLEDLLVSQGGGIRNVIVALANVPRIPTPPPAHLVLDNRDCRFVPHVSVLTVGSTIEATNSDALLHTVHLYGAVRANIALPFKGLEVERMAARPGMIVVKCDVHGWMQAFIRVDNHPFHAVTDPDGHFRIPDIPAGTYDLEIWHERLGRQRKTIRVEASKTQHIDVEYTLKDQEPY